MTVYASWDEYTDRYLRDDGDDTYIRPIISFLLDDPSADNDHATCSICHTFDVGARWVPDNGGAWVNSGSWQAARQSVDKYLKVEDEFNIW